MTDARAAYPASPYCTSTCTFVVLGKTRCDKPAGHSGWHRWQVEWLDPRQGTPSVVDSADPDALTAQASAVVASDHYRTTP